jgi:hypothetical protein
MQCLVETLHQSSIELQDVLDLLAESADLGLVLLDHRGMDLGVAFPAH